jgi:aspartyl protease family protein
MAAEDAEAGAQKSAAEGTALKLQVDGSERVATKPKDRERYVWFVPAFFVVVLLLGGLGVLFSPQIMNLPRIVVFTPSGGGASQVLTVPRGEPIPPPPHPAAGAYDLSPEAARLDKFDVKRTLTVLQREPCDSSALHQLATALKEADHRRDAARAQMAFSRKCGGHWGFLYDAANTLLNLNDNAAVLAAADGMIALQPHDGTGYYLRALANAKLGAHKLVVDDLVSTVELAGFRNRLHSGVFTDLARSYEALGQPCDAAMAIDTWVGIDRATRDTPQTRAMISKHEARGNCAANRSGEKEIIAVSDSNVAVVPVTVNGVRGRFIVDTGASFVSMPRSFATQAGVEIDENSSLLLHTANGTAKGKLGRATEVSVRSLKSRQVQVIVQDGVGGYGPGIDGLLGMSFLSRFDVIISSGTVRLVRRGNR